MKTLNVAFVWNQHQPFYQDTQTRAYIMPWTRLHASKDYYQMAAILEQYPKIHQTINLTPSLLKQVEDYLAGCEDYYLKVMKPAEKLSGSEKRYLLQHYFDIHWEKVIEKHPRYRSLLELQGRLREPESVDQALPRFTVQDYRDLQVWFNLAWIDPELRRADPFLSKLEQKGEGFSEGDRLKLLERQMEFLRQVVPVHRRLQEKGQIEIVTSAFYHPILPLLIDSNSALRSSPGLPLPRHFHYPEDAYNQLKMARQQYGELFGRPAQGAWPPEQAVSPEIIPVLAGLGFAWTISDEQILARSLGLGINRDSHGHVLNGDMLYQPYRVSAAGSEVAIVFRDQYLSDRIGFEYQHFRPEDAAADLIQRLHRIRENLAWSQSSHLVTVSLDGENAWEWYQGDKGPFLHSLYRQLSNDHSFRCVTVSEHLTRHPPRRQIGNLFTGSWVDHNLTRWIGTENKNQLWNYLLYARETVERYRNSPKPDQGKLQAALHNIYIAEGSDYSWWIDSMPYYLAAPFEALFRKHLANVYRSLGLSVPAYLSAPLLYPCGKGPGFGIDPLAGPLAIATSHDKEQ